jgi:hypothetical protein
MNHHEHPGGQNGHPNDLHYVAGGSINEAPTTSSRLGSLTHLKTTVELRAGDTVVQAYVVKIPAKAANEILK